VAFFFLDLFLAEAKRLTIIRGWLWQQPSTHNRYVTGKVVKNLMMRHSSGAANP
jgi:hypothetical protein